MPTININRKVFEKLAGKKLSLENLKDRISMLGTDLEKVTDKEIVVEIFPDRPDMLSEQGFARAFSSFIGAKKGLRKYKVNKSNEKVIIESSVKKVRPFTACAIIKDLTFDNEKIKEVIQIQEKLHVTYGRNRKKAAIGVYPFEKIKTPIRFLAKKPEDIKFRPLEYSKEINGRQILSKHPAGRDYGYLLEGYDVFPVFVDANDEVLSMPPIINSYKTGKITTKTKDVFIECSGFDYDVLSKCLNIVVTALADMGGKIYSMEIKDGNKKIVSPNLNPERMKIDVKNVNKLLGLDLKEKDVKKYLERMGYDYSKGKVLVPAYRADVIHEVDLIEDIAIAYGYENFKEEIPNVATIGEEDKFEVFKRNFSEILAGAGLLETNSFTLIPEKDLENMGIDYPYVKVENPSSEYTSLRNWMIPSLLKILSENKHYEFPQKLFEIGKIVKSNYSEAERIGIVLCHDKANFTEMKQIMDYLFNSLDLKYDIKEAEHGSFISGRCGRISVKGKNVGYIGEVHPKCLSAFGLKFPVSAFELNLSDLFSVI